MISTFCSVAKCIDSKHRLAAKPNLDFVLIINPSSGPGSSQYPDEQYTAALTQLAKYPNVHKVGYVRTGYATRNVTDVISEINVFSGWASKGPAFAMEGIFFDESPHQYSAEAVDFMLKASRAVKDATGLQGAKTVVSIDPHGEPLAADTHEKIRNPGVIPDPKFADSRTDISVTFEQSFTEYQTKEADLAAYKDDRKSQCYMVHSIPSMDKGKLRTFVDDLSKRAEYLFVTSNKENYYESFAEDWAEFIDAIPAS